MSKYTIIAGIFAILTAYLGITALLKDHKSKLNILFFFVCFSMFIFSFNLGLAYSAPDKNTVFLFAKTAFIGIFLILPVNLHFYLVLAGKKTSRILLFISYIPFAIFSIVEFLTQSIVIDYVKYKGEWTPVLGFENITTYLYIAYYIVYVFASLLIIYRWGIQTESNKEKLYSKIMFISFLISYIFGTSIVIIFPAYNNYDFLGFTPGFTMFYIIALFFLIKKYKFMNINFSIMTDEILANISEIVVIIGTDWKILNANNKFKELFEFEISRQEMINSDFKNFILEDNFLNDKFKEMLENKINNYRVKIVFKKDDREIITSSYISIIKDRFKDNLGFLVISSEIKGIVQFLEYFKLTKREFEIIEKIISGSTYKGISGSLKITEKTVEAHLTNIYNKLGINNKVELINICLSFNVKPYHLN